MCGCSGLPQGAPSEPRLQRTIGLDAETRPSAIAAHQVGHVDILMVPGGIPGGKSGQLLARRTAQINPSYG
jgi:hypothetical protein